MLKICRVWRVLSLAAPSANLSPFTDANADDYPFSIEVDSLLTEEDLMRYQRDHYEGTQFSTAEGLAAGPYGNPNRYDGGANGAMTKRDSMDGEFPRDISLFRYVYTYSACWFTYYNLNYFPIMYVFRTIYSFVTKSRSDTPDVLSMLWVCQYAPDLSAYVPMYVESERLSKAWITGSALVRIL
jgi:dipeptidase